MNFEALNESNSKMNGSLMNYYYDPDDFHDDFGLNGFYEWFRDIHGYASVVVCAFGIITNVLNITVLLAKTMRSATNYLLAVLAVSDILTMMFHIPSAIHFYCPYVDIYQSPWMFSKSWTTYFVIDINVKATTHTISIWLAVTLAGFRFYQIRSPCPNGSLAKRKRVQHMKLASFLICLCSILALIPNYIRHEIEEVYVGVNQTAYALNFNSPQSNPFVFANIVTYALLSKIIPCILIIIFSGSLLYHMTVKTAQRRQRLSTSNQHANTTRMLLAVLILFVVVEFPQGILLILVASVPWFYDHVYHYIGDVVDFVTLLNNAVNFILYCVMSQQFRDKFYSIYLAYLCKRRRNLLSPNSELIILREQIPCTMTTASNDENNQTI